jgi:tRNA pseudouridine55 synthase
VTAAGILLVDKPEGPTSHDVVERVREAARLRRAGHAGTLDPFASGLLLVLLGSATRLSEYFLEMDKEYEATVHLGVETETHDPEGDILSENPGWNLVAPRDLEAAMACLRGKISQTPPSYSAKKIQGEPAHRRVRRGEAVSLEPVEVEVHDLKVKEVALPEVRIAVCCSSGTYIRALARDLGRSLGVGGYLSVLRRTAIGPFSVASAMPLEALTGSEAILANLVQPAVALSHLPRFDVGPEEADRIRHGQFLSVPPDEIPDQTPFLVLLDGVLVAMASREGDRLRPQKVFGAES